MSLVWAIIKRSRGITEKSENDDISTSLSYTFHRGGCDTHVSGRRSLVRPRLFSAAVVEELCSKTGFPCPAWTKRQDYVLEHPWFYSSQPSQRDWLLATTPEAFKCRNIFIGGSVLDNKYELHQMFGSKPRWTPWSEQELQHLMASKESAEAEIVP